MHVNEFRLQLLSTFDKGLFDVTFIEKFDFYCVDNMLRLNDVAIYSVMVIFDYHDSNHSTMMYWFFRNLKIIVVFQPRHSKVTV